MNSKKIFAESLEKLLYKKNLDEISAKEIVQGTNLSRRTFYRHFCDKYDLANWYFDQLYMNSFGRIVYDTSWEEALYHCLTIYEERKLLFINGYDSRDINGLVNHDIKVTRKIYEDFLRNKGVNTNSETLKFAIDIASVGGTYMVIKWLRSGTKIEKRRLVELIKMTLPNELLQYL